MPPISLLIKPASSLCNLSCKYCFYHDVSENREVSSYGIMNRELIETIVRKGFAQADGFISFAFQGGEPTLAGLDFFQYFIELQKKYNTRRINVYNSIQTNGIVIDSAWARFFKQNSFLVGLSLDGNKEINDNNRVFANGDGSFDRIMKTVKIFNNYNVDYNILSVVTSRTCKNIDKIYRFYKSKNFRYLQFIPCLDPLGEERGKYEHSLTPDLYEMFLKNLFDNWYDDYIKGNYISIRQFDNWINILMGKKPESCGMSGECSCYFVIEADGSVYPCDFYVIDKYKLGNVQNLSFSYMANQEESKEFVLESKLALEKCLECKHYNICRGGCKRDRLDNLVDNYYCSALYNFFDYSFPRMTEIANKLKKTPV